MHDAISFPPRAISAALARRAFVEDRVRLTDTRLDGCDVLVASRQGVFGVGRDGTVACVVHGFFFGVRAAGGMIYLFESCDRPRARSNTGRVVRLHRAGQRLVDPVILAKGIDNQCHQLALFDDALWVVDTANQAILQFAPDGATIGRRTPFPMPPSAPGDSGLYLHINALARIGDQIAVMLHNGGARPPRPSELAWLDSDWTLVRRQPLDGHGCHDIVADDHGVVWHCDSMGGAIINSTGFRTKVSERMTRGLAVTPDTIVIGSSKFGAREDRETLAGSVIFLSRDLSVRTEIQLPAAPTDLIML